MRFNYIPTIEAYLSFCRGSLAPTKILMSPNTWAEFKAELGRKLGRPHPPMKFQGAELEVSFTIPDNELEFLNAIEPNDETLNGRVAIEGKEWRRVSVTGQPATTA